MLPESGKGTASSRQVEVGTPCLRAPVSRYRDTSEHGLAGQRVQKGNCTEVAPDGSALAVSSCAVRLPSIRKQVCHHTTVRSSGCASCTAFMSLC